MAGAERAEDDVLADCTDYGWFYSLPVATKVVAGPGDVRFVDADKKLLFYADGTVRFRHRCDRGERGVIYCSPALRLDGGHTITTLDPVMEKVSVTVSPSIACPDCGTHGFIENGRWRDA